MADRPVPGRPGLPPGAPLSDPSAAATLSPCLTCGACCATYRVSFYFGEALGDDGVPDELTTQIGPFRAAMLGTDAPRPRCVALEGEIGRSTRCAIWPRRPTPCREFAASWEDGVHEERCDAARARHGLPPLAPRTS